MKPEPDASWRGAQVQRIVVVDKVVERERPLDVIEILERTVEVLRVEAIGYMRG